MARRLRSWCLHWAKTATRICLAEAISAALERRASAQVATSIRGQAAATYRTSQGTYFVFRATSGAISAYRITATNPPTIVPAWNVSQNGQGSPWVTTTNGTANAIVWAANSGSGDQRLRGFNGDTGAVVYADGGGPYNELMNGTSGSNTGIVARGRMSFAGTDTGTPLLCRDTVPPAAIAFGLTNHFSSLRATVAKGGK